jgi:ATP-binding cassette subfamily B protein
VLVLSRGRIIEDGPPAVLLTEAGEYAALHASWLESLA